MYLIKIVTGGLLDVQVERRDDAKASRRGGGGAEGGGAAESKVDPLQAAPPAMSPEQTEWHMKLVEKAKAAREEIKDDFPADPTEEQVGGKQ